MRLKTDYNLEFAQIIDAEAIAELEKENFSSPWSLTQIIEEIKNPNSFFLTAKCGNNVLGYVSGQLIIDEFYISNIAVKSAYRNNGIATALLNTLIDIVRNKRAAFITLEVRESNTVARTLYEKLGFKNLGIRKNFYSHPTENANIYTLFFNNEVENIENISH